MPNHCIAGQAKLYIAGQTKPTYDYDSHILSHHTPRTFKSVLQRISEEAHRGGPQSACGKLHILPAAERGVPWRGEWTGCRFHGSPGPMPPWVDCSAPWATASWSWH